MSFPVIHSTLDPTALAAYMEEHFDLAPPVSCRLVARGSNDIYDLKHGAGRLALRVAKANFRSVAEVRFELDLLDFLGNKGVKVAKPVVSKVGERCLTVEAPEGIRNIVAFRWINGKSCHPLTEKQARMAGRLLGNLHLEGMDFRHTDPRSSDIPGLIREREASLRKLLVDRPDAEKATMTALSRYDDFQSSGMEMNLTKSVIHGDFQPANMLLQEGDSSYVIDFDECAFDCLIRDLACFLWRNRFDEVETAVDRAFIEGYSAIRPLSSFELESLPMFVLARNLHIFATYAGIINRVGPIPGFQSFERFLELMQVEETVQELLKSIPNC